MIEKQSEWRCPAKAMTPADAVLLYMSASVRPAIVVVSNDSEHTVRLKISRPAAAAGAVQDEVTTLPGHSTLTLNLSTFSLWIVDVVIAPPAIPEPDPVIVGSLLIILTAAPA